MIESSLQKYHREQRRMRFKAKVLRFLIRIKLVDLSTVDPWEYISNSRWGANVLQSQYGAIFVNRNPKKKPLVIHYASEDDMARAGCDVDSDVRPYTPPENTGK